MIIYVSYLYIICVTYVLLNYPNFSRLKHPGSDTTVAKLLCTTMGHGKNALAMILASNKVIEGSLEVKLPTIWRDEKAVSREKSQKRKDQKKEDASARKGRKVAKHCVFSWFCGSGGLKSRLAKAAGAEHISKSKCTKHTIVGPVLEVKMSKKCTPLWREAHFQVKMYKTPQLWTTFGSWDVEKVHAIVARSTFPSQNVQCTTCSGHFWRFRCRKSARRCGAKHISKSKCTKH